MSLYLDDNIIDRRVVAQPLAPWCNVVSMTLHRLTDVWKREAGPV
jgi:hypothetical protein